MAANVQRIKGSSTRWEVHQEETAIDLVLSNQVYRCDRAKEWVVKYKLLDLDHGTSFDKLCLDGFCLFLGNLLLDGAWGCVYDVLGLFQTKTGQGLDDFHDVELIGTSVLQNDIKLALSNDIIVNCCCAATATCHHHWCSCCWLNTVIILENIGKLLYFLDGKIYKLLCKCFQICHFLK